MAADRSELNDQIQREPINPQSFADLFRHLRMRKQLSSLDMARLIGYSQHSIHVNETTVRNPTTKTLMRYVQRTRLSMTITSAGITLYDPSTGTDILRNWEIVIE
jgi:DNA-binding XRE family transcriptional regulator